MKIQLLSAGAALAVVLTGPAAFGGPDEYLTYDFNVTGPATVTGITFRGYSGVITNGPGSVTTSYEVFNNTPDCPQAAFIQSYPASGGEIDCTMTNLTVGKTYTLSFLDAANRVVGQEALTLSTTGGQMVDVSTSSPDWRPQTYSFAPTSTSDTSKFVGGYTGSNAVIGLDGFKLSLVEPAAWAMMLIGFGGLGALLRTRRRADREPGAL